MSQGGFSRPSRRSMKKALSTQASQEGKTTNTHTYIFRSIVCVLYETNLGRVPDVKPDNVLVNYGSRDHRFTDVQLADMGSTVPATSAYAKDGDMIGAPIWRSPEAHLQIGWGTPTDIWSFGALVSAGC